jgi:MFS family permease
MAPGRLSTAHPSGPRAAIAISGLGAFLCSLDAALNVAFPAISADLGVTPRQIALVIVFYHVPIGILTVIGGLLGDRFGHRRVFAWGVWTSALAFPLCGLAPDYGWLLAARVVQGAGAGLVFGTAPALVTLGLVRARRGLGLGVLNFAAGTGLAGSPMIAGVLVDTFGWRSVFLFRVPLAVIVGAVVAYVGGPATPTEAARRPEHPDAAGARPGGDGRVRGDERPAAGQKPSLSPALVLGNGLAVMANAASFAIYVFVPYYLIDVARHPATIAGLIFMTVPLSTSLGGLAGGWLTRRLEPRRLVVVGLTLETAGLFAITRLQDGSHVAAMVAAFVLTGFGLGLFQVPNMTVVMAALPDRNQGLAGGMISAMRTVGVLTAALLSPWLFAVRQTTHQALQADPSALFLAAFSDTFLVCTLVAASALTLAVVLRRHSIPR